MISMLMNWLCSIPENVGWILVGMVLCLCVQMFGLLVGTIINAIKERMEDEEEEEEC